MTTTQTKADLPAVPTDEDKDLFAGRAARDPAWDDGADDRGGHPPIVRATDLAGVHILKHENTFMLSSAHGDIRPDDRGLGMYHSDTRVLSRYDLLVNSIHPAVLRAGPAASFRSTIQLTNPDVFADSSTPSADSAGALDGSEIVLRRHSLGIVRDRVISGGLREKITVTNYTTSEQPASLTLSLDADFADIFELRGALRRERGRRLPNVVSEDRVTFVYEGLDSTTRETHVAFSPHVTVVAGGDDGEAQPVSVELSSLLAPGASATLTVEVWFDAHQTAAGEAVDADEAAPRIDADQAIATHRAWRQSSSALETSDFMVARALDRASADLRLLLNIDEESGDRYVAAGVPWFSCLFGRDSIITAYQMLSVRPQIARNTLSLLARLQATEVDDWRDAQPGKILHELRTGEMARNHEIPHTPYYGTVDATPLWLMLLDEYERWTADDELVDKLWPNALAALNWIERYGDIDGDGFVEYSRRSELGIANQGWKDSRDSIRFRDGSLAQGAIALVEVQGYVYAARRAIARLARLRGDNELAEQQDAKSALLQRRFEESFWLDDAGTYAIALDGDKKAVDGIASNAGHALWSGIVSADRAASVARALNAPDMWSGWGIRTLSRDTVGYNPIGYHLGTVWPHDNGICVAGFARYGLFDEARRVTGALLEATLHFREARLPELFCGFDRDHSPMPVPYPVACSPQAWAAGSLFHMISATLGLRPDARHGRLEVHMPALPDGMRDLRVRNLRIGDGLLDIGFERDADTVQVEVLRRTGDIDVVAKL
jgi:glycogen debranching enzyme